MEELSIYTHLWLIKPFKLPADALLSQSKEIHNLMSQPCVNKWQQPTSWCSEHHEAVKLKQDEEWSSYTCCWGVCPVKPHLRMYHTCEIVSHVIALWFLSVL